MKKYILVISMILCGLLAFGGSAWSYTIAGGIDVGGLDSFVTSTDLSNSGVSEIAWVNSLGYGTFTVYGSVETNWKETLEATGTWALDLLDSPEYFFVKIGAKPGEADHILFKNNADFNWAVIAFSTSDYTIKNVGKISHVGELGTQVPEPGMILLFGSGLLGLGLLGRKRSR